ncbi:MAG: hypothetical protein GXO91_06795 [FCB group bacterium]|nr:hypothetical protein [FCB group bacterium]
MKTPFRIIALLFILVFFSAAFSQGTWIYSNRVHSELTWYTLETDHFNVHYHNGIEDIARRGASIAEQVYPILLQQVNISSTPKIDIVFTSEDEIMNGYALWTNQTFIWVDQNDAAIWLEDGKWLYQVIAHEMEHIVFFNAVRSWMPEPFGLLFSGTPGWFIEGLAEFCTEHWRPYRADISHKQHVFKNTMKDMNPHHDGYSKLLLLADEFGDSAIVKIVNYRNKLGLFRFAKAFKKTTGMSVSQFNEHWRRVMNTYYYGYQSQKEAIQDVGKTATLPLSTVYGFAFSPDSLRIALIGKLTSDQLDQSLIIAEQDTVSKKDKEEQKTDQKKKKPAKPHYQKNEIDYGRFHSFVSWSPDGKLLAYSKYHFGQHGSMLWDIRIYDRESKKGRWVTLNQRATYPTWSPDGNKLTFVSHSRGTSNLFNYDLAGDTLKKITSYTDDTQILTPAWSPDGRQIAYAASGPDGNCDIVVMDIDTRKTRRITSDPALDYIPIWHPEGGKITYTSHTGSTPNLHTVNLKTGASKQITDVGEAIWGKQWTPKGNSILASTLNDVDSVRIVQVVPDRKTSTSDLSLRQSYTNWRTKAPVPVLEDIDPSRSVGILKNEKYKFYEHPKHYTSFILPLDVLTGATIWSDALGKHIFSLFGGTTWDGKYPFGLVQYENAQQGPLWGIMYFYNTNWSFRFYDGSDSGLIEKFDGFNFWTKFPFNFGNSMASNHSLTVGLTLMNRDFEPLTDDENGVSIDHVFTDDGLPPPDKGKEGLVQLNYKWIQHRPTKSDAALPKNGFGLSLSFEAASKNIYGKFNYQKYIADSYLNYPLGPGALFFRGKGILLEGTPPSQEYVGITNDISIYGPGQTGTYGLPENHFIRGWDTIRLGDRMLYGTAEMRFPLLKSFPVEILGITIGETTGAVFSDFGNSWYSGTAVEEFIVTAGYEVKIGISGGKSPFFFVAVGESQTIDRWRDRATPETYLRFALINPF